MVYTDDVSISGFPCILKSPEFGVFINHDLKSPEIGLGC